MGDYIQSYGVAVMPIITQKDLDKPVFKKFWHGPVGEGREETENSNVSRLDLSKFMLLENMLRSQARVTTIQPVQAVSVSVAEADEDYINAERPAPHLRDAFSASEYVFGLSKCNFHSFINRKDVCMVMFYDDENNEKVLWARDQFSKAARSTKRENHGFGIINCNLHRELCQEEGVCTTPMFKVYSRGSTISKIQEVCTISSDVIKTFVESAPLFENPRKQSSYKDVMRYVM